MFAKFVGIEISLKTTYFERGGKAFCENDYFELFSPRCAYCNGPIRDVVLHNNTFNNSCLEMRPRSQQNVPS